MKKREKQLLDTSNDEDKKALEEMLREVIKDSTSNPKLRMQAGEVLGRMRDRGWFSRPGDADHGGARIDRATARMLAELMNENFVLMDRKTAEALGLKDSRVHLG